MPFRPANLVHTDEAALAESTASAVGTGSLEPGESSSAEEHHVHTVGVVGSNPSSRTIQRRRKPTKLYFVHAPQSGRLKIGISVEPLARFAAIKTGAGEPLELLGWTDYSHCRPEEVRALEQELHAAFAPWRLEGEWFEALPDILQFAHETRDPETAPQRRDLPVIDPDAYVDPRRPVIPDGVAAPKGDSRKARMERYKLARGLTQ